MELPADFDVINPNLPPADINAAYAGLFGMLKQLLKQVNAPLSGSDF